MLALANEVDAEKLVFPAAHGQHDAHVALYLGSLTEPVRGPQAVASSFPADHVVDPHFHEPDQYQVFVAGSSRVGKHRTDPVTVMYNDGFTPYGPIVAGDEGMTYFVLRARGGLERFAMPGSRDKLLRRAGRQFIEPASLSRDADRGRVRLETIIPPQDDGLASYEISAGPGARIPEPVTAGAGCYLVVVDGTVELGDASLAKGGLAFVSAGERFPLARAGEEGAHVLELHFPFE